MAVKGVLSVLSDIVNDYVTGYLNQYSLEWHTPKYDDEKVRVSFDDVDTLLSRPSWERETDEVIGLDGSSRSLVSSRGIISIASVASSSSRRPVVGVFPSFGVPEIAISSPFVAVAPALPERRGMLDPYLYSSSEIMTVSTNGEPLTASMGPERIEGELRLLLETKALETLQRDYPIKRIFLDGPLMPRDGSREAISGSLWERRRKIVEGNVIGVVKRLNRSTLLLRSFSGETRRDFISKYGIDPVHALSDEAILQGIVRFYVQPPFQPYVFGPLRVSQEGFTYFVKYLLYPIHRYVRKFYFLRIESTHEDLSDVSSVLSYGLTMDGVSNIVAIADRLAKETTDGLRKLMFYKLDQLGIPASFESRIEVA